jgi:hypothetical protein
LRFPKTPFTQFIILVLIAIPVFSWLNIGGLDFDPQYYVAGRGWPRIYDAVALIPVSFGGVYGIFLPWAVAFVQPFTLFPLVIARAIVQALSLAAFIALAGPHLLSRLTTLSNPLVLLILFNQVNLDAIATAGLLLPPAGGLLLLAMKPQVAGLAALVWLWQGQWKHFVPAGVVIVLSTLLWSEWIPRVTLSPEGALNVSFFPWSLILAIPLLILAVRRQDVWIAGLATPLAVPYIALYSLAPTCAIINRLNWRWGLIINIIGWIAGAWLYSTGVFG